jgi:hypothetical protein
VLQCRLDFLCSVLWCSWNVFHFLQRPRIRRVDSVRFSSLAVVKAISSSNGPIVRLRVHFRPACLDLLDALLDSLLSQALRSCDEAGLVFELVV